MEDVFVRYMLDLTTAMDRVCVKTSMPLCHRVDGIEEEWAQKIHPFNALQAARNSLSCQDRAFDGHLDSQNDP